MKKLVISILFISLLLSCADYKYESFWMDSEETRDPALTDPSYKVSTRFKSEKDHPVEKPVIICVHGHSGSSYEWWECRDYIEANSDILVSLVVLGGHGTSLKDFQKSTWQDWQKPIIREYKALSDLGYRNINMAGSSTGAPLILEALFSNRFKDLPALKNIFFIDPFIIPVDRNLYIIDIAGIFIKNVPIEGERTREEYSHFYTNRPQETLSQLKNLILLVEDRLKNKYNLESGTYVSIFKSKDDETADIQGAYLIKQGIIPDKGLEVTLRFYDSCLHVLTYVKGRKSYTQKDSDIQTEIFNYMIQDCMSGF